MARQNIEGEKPLFWVGSSRDGLLEFPAQVRREIGNALGVAQFGGKHPAAKPWKGDGGGVFEIVEDFDKDTYRAVYCVRFSGAVYVLHAFQKKSPKGIKTAKGDVEMVARRLKLGREMYEKDYGKEK